MKKSLLILAMLLALSCTCFSYNAMISQRSGNIGNNSSAGANAGGYSSTGANAGGYSSTGVNAGGYSSTGVNAGGYSSTGVNAGGYSSTGANAGGHSGTGANTRGNSSTRHRDDDDSGNAIPSLSGTQTNFTSGYPPLVTDPHAQTAVALGYPAPCGTANNVHTSQNGVITGFLVYTIYNGTGQPNTTISNVKRVAFRYDGKKFTVAKSTAIATTTGADGILALPNGNLIVGSEGHETFLLSPRPGPVKAIPVPNNIISDHVAYDSVRNVIWTSGYASAGSAPNLVEISLNTFRAVSRQLKGDDSHVTMIAFDSSHNAYYTDSETSGFGSVGSINLATFTTVRKIQNIPGAHGAVFDHFTNTLIVVGSNHITQINPKTFSIVSDWMAPPEHSTFQLDQAAVDGRGHLWATSNDGNLVFIDYSHTRKVASSSNYNYYHFIEDKLDDIALLCRS
jgi:hypothetical protein